MTWEVSWVDAGELITEHLPERGKRVRESLLRGVLRHRE